MKSWLLKQRYLLDYTLSALWRRKARNASLFCVYTLIVFVLASVVLYSAALKREAATLLTEAPEVVVQRLMAGRHDLVPQEYIPTLKKIRGVTMVRGRLWGYFYDPVAQANYTMMVSPEITLNSGEIIVGNGFSRTKRVFVGDTVSFRSYEGRPFLFTIKQIMSAESEIATSDLILICEDDFYDFFQFPKGKYTDVIVDVRNRREVETIAQKILTAFPDTRPILKSEILMTYESVFKWREGIVLLTFVGALFAFIIFAWDKASGLSAEEKKEIGILKAIGWNTHHILNMKLWEGAAISISAFLLGFLLAYVHVFYTRTSLFEPVLKGWAVLYPSFTLVPFVDWMEVATLFLLTVVPYSLATIVPVWKTAITDPVDSMRGV